MDSYEGQNNDPLTLHKYLYCHGNPVDGIDPSGNFEGLGGAMASMAINSALVSMAIGAPFRAIHAAQQLQAGVGMGTVVGETLLGVLTDGAIGAALPGIFSYLGRGLTAGLAAIRTSQTFVRAADSVWNLGAFARGWEIESRILGGMRRLAANFPVIDDCVNGVATSIKSIDLTAATYNSAAHLTRVLGNYAHALSRFPGAFWGGVRITAADMTERVLVVAVEDGVATVEQMTVINDFVNKAKLLWPNIKVMIVPVP